MHSNKITVSMINILMCCTLIYNCVFALQCVDHNKNPVDWYVIYKLPLEKHVNPLISQGAAYVYMTPDDVSWNLATISINDTNSLVGLTLENLFNQEDSNSFYISYNDEKPDGSINFKKGHTKGVVLGDSNGGIWLVHSVPKFPAKDAGHYYYPHNGYQYGQSFLCISLDISNLNHVGIQLQYNLPNILDKNMPDYLKPVLPNLVDVMNDVTVKSAPWFHLAMLKSRAGLIFTSFAKSPKFSKELYADWVAPTLNIDLLAETWPNGPGRLPSECTERFKVYNVKTIGISQANFSFTTTVDHSKWAVVSKNNTEAKWICIGDINRSTPQRKRGGGTVCFSSGTAVTMYQKSAIDIESC